MLEDFFMTATYSETDDLKNLGNACKYDTKSAHPIECQYGDNELCYNES